MFSERESVGPGCKQILREDVEDAGGCLSVRIRIGFKMIVKCETFLGLSGCKRSGAPGVIGAVSPALGLEGELVEPQATRLTSSSSTGQRI